MKIMINIMCVLIGASGVAFGVEKKIDQSTQLKIEIQKLKKLQKEMGDSTFPYRVVSKVIEGKEKRLKNLLPDAKL